MDVWVCVLTYFRDTSFLEGKAGFSRKGAGLVRLEIGMWWWGFIEEQEIAWEVVEASLSDV